MTNESDVKQSETVSGGVASASLGPSNDAPREVRIEIRAAELESASEELTDREWEGATTSPDSVCHCESHGADWEAGYLLAEMVGHSRREERDEFRWTWDHTRPVSGQYEEWLTSQWCTDRACP